MSGVTEIVDKSRLPQLPKLIFLQKFSFQNIYHQNRNDQNVHKGYLKRSIEQVE
jgi:hypothetical protein